MVKRKLIHVTEEDIKNGKRTSAFYCPIANALNREFGLIEACSATLQTTKVRYKGKDDIYNTIIKVSKNSRKVSKFIHDFDYSIKVRPFNFYFVPLDDNS